MTVEGFALEGSPKDWRLSQETCAIRGTRQLVLASALRNVPPGSLLYVTPAKKPAAQASTSILNVSANLENQDTPQAAPISVPSSAAPSPTAQYEAPTHENVPLGQESRKLSHRPGKESASSLPRITQAAPARQNATQAAPARQFLPTADTNATQAAPARQSIPASTRTAVDSTQALLAGSSLRSAGDMMAPAKQSAQIPSSSTSRLHVNAARADDRRARSPAASVESFLSSLDSLDYAPGMLPDRKSVV